MKKLYFSLFLFLKIIIIIVISFSACNKNKYNTKEKDGDNVTKIISPSFVSDADTGKKSSEQTGNTEIPTIKPVYEKHKVSFLAVGDNITYFGNLREAEKYAAETGRTYNFKHQYSEITDLIEKADIAFINQETLMAGGNFNISYYPRFNTPQDMGYDIAEIGFNLVNVANNHMLDWGARGLIDTINFWRDNTDVFTLGDYLNENEYTHRIYEKNDIKIAFLSYTYGTNSGIDRNDTGVIIPYINEEIIKKQIPTAQKESDIVIVSVHWGDENTFSPNEKQKKYASLMCELGADVIIGHHPHVIQPVEWIISEDKKNKTLCVYSLGNIVAEMSNDFNMIGGIFTFDIVKEGPDTFVENPIFNPTLFYYDKSFYENRVYLFSDVTEAFASSHGVVTYKGASVSYEKFMKYIKNTIDISFLPEIYK